MMWRFWGVLVAAALSPLAVILSLTSQLTASATVCINLRPLARQHLPLLLAGMLNIWLLLGVVAQAAATAVGRLPAAGQVG